MQFDGSGIAASAYVVDVIDRIDPEDTQAAIGGDCRDTTFMRGADDRLVQVLGFAVSEEDLQTRPHRREEFLTVVGGPFVQQQSCSLACGPDHLAIFPFRKNKYYGREPSRHIESHRSELRRANGANAGHDLDRG